MSAAQNAYDDRYNKEKLRRSIVWTYGSVGLPLAIIGYPLAIWVPPLYASTVGVSLGAIGTMLMLARLSDVITDPLVGDLSDRLRSRWGRRKPWLVFGVPVMLIGIYMLFVPPDDAGMLYLLIWVSVMYLGSTMIALPYGAWGAELSPFYHQRSRITASREGFVLIGLVVAAMVPVGVAQFWEPSYSNILEGMAWTIIVILPISVLIVVKWIPEPAPTGRDKVPLAQGLKSLMKNGPMRWVILILLLITMGEAFRNALTLFFMRDRIGFNTANASYLYAVYFVVAISAIPMWLWLGRKIGKHRALTLAICIVAIVSALSFLLGYGDNVPYVTLFLIKGICFGAIQFLPLAMLADVVDVDSIRTGGKRAGSFFALGGMTAKLAVAIGTGISYNLAEAFGYDASGAAGANTDADLTMMAFQYTIMPVIFYLPALWMTWIYPLTAERQERLRVLIEKRHRRIEERLRGQKTATAEALALGGE